MHTAERKNFGQLRDVLPIPDLIEIQTKSYDEFLQKDVAPELRKYQGLQEVFQDIFPSDQSENSSGLEFISYEIEKPSMGVVDCLKDGGTYQAPLYATFRLHLPNQKETKQERVRIGDIPLMTDRGSFVINGAERVIVSQLHRSPGVCFERTRHTSGKDLCSYKIIADHGSWLEVQYDSNDLMYIFLDRKHRRRKFLISMFLRAFGVQSDRELLDTVYGSFFLRQNSRRLEIQADGTPRIQPLFGEPHGKIADSEADLIDPDRATLPHWLGVLDVPVEQLREMDMDALAHIYTAEPVVNPEDAQEVLIESLTSLTEKDLEIAAKAGVEAVACVDTSGMGDSFIRCIQKEYVELGDQQPSPEEARKEIYRKMRPSDQATDNNARMLFNHTFEDVRRYDLGRVGRYRVMKRLFQSPGRCLKNLISEDEAATREKWGKLRVEDLEKGFAYFQSLFESFHNGDISGLDDEIVLETLFSSNAKAYGKLFAGASAFTQEGMRLAIHQSWTKFLKDSKKDSVLSARGGVLVEYVKASISDMQDALRKAAVAGDVNEDVAKKSLPAMLKQIASAKKFSLAEALSAEPAGKEDARTLALLLREYLCGVVMEATNVVQDFLKTRRYLTQADVAASTAYLMRLRNECCVTDDIDHLGRRRIRTIGELLQNQCRVGMLRMSSVFRDKLNGPDVKGSSLAVSAADISITKNLNTKPLSAQIRDFFSRNQLSQFMDQTNCLAEITNKRRLSALGPGGLTRERAGFEVRDVHSSHYGRVCPIETPEGPNIGLISSLALYAKLDEFGFINTPYRKVENCRVTDEIEYLPADREEPYVIAQANAPQDKKGVFVNKYVLARTQGESAMLEREKVNYIDVSPRQLISAAAGLIPFLEHDDANRALMGSNMQRQAVPLLKPERPVVGTGLEDAVARYSRATTNAREAGIVASANATRILITKDGKMPEETAYPESVQEYNLYKFLRSNASTFVNQHPIVKRGQKVEEGQAIADSSCTDQGELALGRNLTVAYMSWHGYNYEDAIIISKRLVSEDIYTSIHVSLEDVIARDTKLGPEEITRDIPNVGEEALRNLDAEGVIRVGAEVKAGDILVGKITPKNTTDEAPEERLMKAIFGSKASDVKDSSLLVPGGLTGIVMDVRVERKPDSSQEKSKAEAQKQRHTKEQKYRDAREDILADMVAAFSAKFLGQKITTSVYRLVDGEQEEIIAADHKITKNMLNRLAQNYDRYQMRDCPEKKEIEEIVKEYRVKLRDNEQCCKEALALLDKGNGDKGGKVSSVKVYLASKRRLSVGDKMAGRHGNKGIVCKIVPVEDMPFMADGTPVDIILNPLGVPSRMNIGQVFETHVGWAARTLGMTVATPVFDGIHEDDITKLLAQAREVKVKQQGWTIDAEGHVRDRAGRVRDDDVIGLDGKTRLYDGRSGEPFVQKIVVGTTYMLKLDHLVANKIHARAVGSYSLVTQQPLGGKAQHGGQRFGEMEVWALEAYGAAYTLQEMLTVKSDDTDGRTKIYESIMRGDCSLQAGTPESFNVLLHEMQSLCLDIRLNRSKLPQQD